MRLVNRCILASGFLLCFVGMAHADFDGPPHGKNFEQRHEHMKQMRGNMLRQRVGLDDEKAKQVEAAFDRFDKEHFALRKNVHTARKKIQALLKSDSEEQQAYLAALKELRLAHDKLHSLRQRQMDSIDKVLTPKQRAKVLVSLHHMKRKHGKGPHGFSKKGGHGHKADARHKVGSAPAAK